LIINDLKTSPKFSVPELEKELKSHPLAIHLCKLARSKGKITLHFLLKGLEMLTNFQQVSFWMKQNDIQKENIDAFLFDLGLNFDAQLKT
jgi:hypothetical protein